MRGLIFFMVFFVLLTVSSADVLVIDTFSGCLSDKFPNLPCNWGPSQSWRNVEMFSLEQQDGNHYVKVRTIGGVTTIGTPVQFSLSKYPVFNWRWRVHALPVGADERIKSRGDSGAGVYVIFQGRRPFNHIIKYVWSTTLSVGTLTQSPHNSRTKIVVLRSGESEKGDWVQESVDLASDYRRLFNAEVPSVVAIAIMSDSDNTRSLVEADYDDFLASTSK